MKYLTIFTPTYNRAELLLDLYKSLCEQINKNFLWLIIDDGSSDNTKELVNKWKKENKIEIQYIYQKNSGKHVAHNKAVELCNTELFVCVDSDDILTNNAVEIIINYWKNDSNNEIDFVAYCSRRGDLSGNPTGKRWIDDKRKISFFDLYEKHKYRGELVLIWISRILKQYSFPVFENEKFVTENVLYYQISYDKPIKLINDVFYLFEYKQDGYTKQGEKLYYKNPYGYAIYRYQVGYLSSNLLKKIRWVARYKGWIKAFSLNKNLIENEFKKMNLNKTNIIINLLSDIYALSYKKEYSKKINIYLE